MSLPGPRELGAGLLILGLSGGAPVFAVPADGGAPDARPIGIGGEPTVLTFRGLLELEKDGKVSDDQKVKEWEAFIIRNQEQVEYARKAVERWTIAPRVRAFEAAQSDEQKQDLSPRDKVDRWKSFATQYPRSPEAKLAEKRIGEWTLVEARRLAEAAGEVERSGANKLERIGAHKKVTEFAPTTPEGKTAASRLLVLTQQLVLEAQNIDRTRGVASESKLEAWRDVLAAAPTPAQKALAQQRIAIYSAHSPN